MPVQAKSSHKLYRGGEMGAVTTTKVGNTTIRVHGVVKVADNARLSQLATKVLTSKSGA